MFIYSSPVVIDDEVEDNYPSGELSLVSRMVECICTRVLNQASKISFVEAPYKYEVRYLDYTPLSSTPAFYFEEVLVDYGHSFDLPKGWPFLVPDRVSVEFKGQGIIFPLKDIFPL